MIYRIFNQDKCICISFLLNILPFLISLSQSFKYNSLIFLLFSKNDISEIFVPLRLKISNLSNLDIGVKSLIFLKSHKFNSLIFLLFSKNDKSEIFV